MLKPVTAFILDLHTVPTGTKRRSACTCISVSSGEEGSVMTMESLRDILHRRQADLLDETNTDDATEDSSSHDDILLRSKTKVQEALLSTRLSDLSCLNNTRVDISTIPAWLSSAGRGLFATRSLQKDEVITCYPGDAVLISKPDADDDEWVEETVIWGSHVDPSKRWEEDDVFDGNEEKDPLTHYACAISDTYSVLGLPTLDANPAYSGHFANDPGGHLALGQADPTQGIEEGIASYVIESIDLSNAMHKEVDGLHMATVATTNITEGEEIMVTYGPNYWMDIM